MQEYLNSPQVSDKQRKIIFQFRSRMVQDIKTNFKGHYKNNLNCPFKCDTIHVDSQENLLICSALKKSLI